MAFSKSRLKDPGAHVFTEASAIKGRWRSDTDEKQQHLVQNCKDRAAAAAAAAAAKLQAATAVSLVLGFSV